MKDYDSEETRTVGTLQDVTPGVVPTPGLTLGYHPVPSRLGAFARLPPRPTVLSRNELEFDGATLLDPYVSRKPLTFRRTDGGVRIDKPDSKYKLTVDGAPAADVTRVTTAQLEKGVVLGIGRRCYAVLHLAGPRHAAPVGMTSLVGVSDPLVRLRAELRKAAPLRIPILLRGETGTGKELAARAVHELSGRRGGPFVAVNMAAINPSTAASELFGHTRGAFTGANRDYDGFFVRAHGGTLFLDEIGELPRDIQGMMLRTLETGEVQRIGDPRPRRVDVWIVAATDSNLEDAVDDGSFTMPLLQRLAGYTLRLPQLRERREDLPPLILHFLKMCLAETGESRRLEAADPGAGDWVLPSDMAMLLAYDWPGNVRELRNIIRQMTVVSQGEPTMRLPDEVRRQMTRFSPPPLAAAPAAARPVASEGPPDAEVLQEVLKRHGYRLAAAAKSLGVARSTLYRWMQEDSSFRIAGELTQQEIDAALAENGGNVAKAALALEVSARGLRRRMGELNK
jgi:two-component system, NtrC family, nitrogen regulation response regulator GlnG